ncbi:glutathione S-transferase family protein [Microbulbifer yueqingensis]|uniref:Glutathione S-transferase n=1 Tax=Microbulbifer yueqingensis TaxID=658219 RepID=A0A1G8XVB9_9GAMM|nr:glutathione S-transferase N-terminal domain-containing protein [Microbulbifer yueqingensis]SDJ93835.1 glutathione S-transferase [Microbulbifer yueqingensis]
MKLFFTHSSPYARTVRILLRESGLTGQVQEIEAHPFSDSPEPATSNPLGKVPCLVRADGEAVMDSEVICRFIDQELGDGHAGRALEQNWPLQTFYSVSNGLIDTLVLRRVELARAEQGLRSDFWWGRYNAAVSRTLTYLELRLELLPDHLSLAHISLGAALSYLDFRHSDIDWRGPHGQLAALSDELERRPAFRDTPLRD